MILVVVGGVVAYQWWMTKPAAIEGGPVDPPLVGGVPGGLAGPAVPPPVLGNNLLNASSFDAAANLTWVKQIRQADIAQGTKFVDDLPCCIVRHVIYPSSVPEPHIFTGVGLRSGTPSGCLHSR
jgi:hypothetical protein